MTIPLRAKMIKKLIAHRFGSVDDFVVEWEERVRSGQQQKGRARNRGTIYRWLDEGLPSRKDDVFGFAAALDVDPITLLRIDDGFIDEHFGYERQLFQVGALNRSRLAPFWILYRSGQNWPDPETSRVFYGRNWTMREHLHDPRIISNVYARFDLIVGDKSREATPWAIHFAYRRANSRDGMWRPYGSVVCAENRLTLISESGDLQELETSSGTSTFPVETYFGPGAAEFRLASLRAFDLRVVVPSPKTSCLSPRWGTRFSQRRFVGRSVPSAIN